MIHVSVGGAWRERILSVLAWLRDVRDHPKLESLNVENFSSSMNGDGFTANKKRPPMTDDK